MGENTDTGDDVYVLSNRRRRLLLQQLQEHESMSVRDLAEQIAVMDQQTNIESLGEEAITEVEVALHHVHAPKLADAGLIEYNERRGIVGVTDEGRQLRIDDPADDVRPEPSDGITVELCPETIDALHEAIRRDDRLDGRMSYDEVVSTVFADWLDAVGPGTETTSMRGDRDV